MMRKMKKEEVREMARKFFYPYKKHYSIFLLFLPVLIWYLMFCYAPMSGILIAFKDYKIAKGVFGSEWVGFENFVKLFRSPTFIRAFKNSIEISFLRILFGFPLPIILALMLNEVRNGRFKKIAQTITYLPHFLSWVVLAGILNQLLAPNTGVINQLLGALGIEPIYFMGDSKWFRFTLITTEIWKSVGWGSIIYIAAITSIDTEQYEAAVIDGASRWQQICYITIPGIMPVITIQLILTSGSIINAGFDQIFNLYNDAVMKVSDIIDTYVYRKGLVDMEYGFSTAAGLFKNVISFGMVIITNFIAKHISEDGYGIW